MLARDVVQTLCANLGHEDSAHACIKKLVVEHWLDKTDDLRYVPRTRFETWGVPLKLIHDLTEFVAEQEVTEQINGINSYVNYSLRPALNSFSASRAFEKLRDDAERRRQPAVWAAKRLQRSFRRRQAARLAAEEGGGTALDSPDPEDFCLPSEDQVEKLRLKRAEEKLSRMARQWKQKRESSGQTPQSRSGQPKRHPFFVEVMSNEASSMAASLAAHARWHPKECAVTDLVRRLGAELQKEEDDIMPTIHRLVTLNWLEDLQDLELVEDRHWEAWGIPEKLVILLKSEVGAQVEASLQAKVGEVTQRVTGFFSGWFN